MTHIFTNVTAYIDGVRPRPWEHTQRIHLQVLGTAYTSLDDLETDLGGHFTPLAEEARELKLRLGRFINIVFDPDEPYEG